MLWKAVLVLAAASCVAAFSPSAPPCGPQLSLRAAPAVCRPRTAASPVVMMVRDANTKCVMYDAERPAFPRRFAPPHCLGSPMLDVCACTVVRTIWPGAARSVARGVAFAWRRRAPEASAPVFGRPRRGEERRPRSRCCSMMQSMVSAKRTRW